MEKLIECGERTVQKLGRISIADIMKTHGLEPGDVVVVDVKVPDRYVIDDIVPTKQTVLKTIRFVDEIKEYTRKLMTQNLSDAQRNEIFVDIFLRIKWMRNSLRFDFDVSKEDIEYFKEHTDEFDD